MGGVITRGLSHPRMATFKKGPCVYLESLGIIDIRSTSLDLLPTRSEEREVLGVGRILVVILLVSM